MTKLLVAALIQPWRERLYRWATERMVDAYCLDNERQYNLPYDPDYPMNPEDMVEIAYVMLCGLLGLTPRPPVRTPQADDD